MQHIPRFYIQTEPSGGASLQLTEEQSHHALKVLRVKIGDCVKLFNPDHGEWLTKITYIHRNVIEVICTSQLIAKRDKNHRRTINLIFSPIKPDRMEYLIEKSVELGVTNLIPTIMDFTNSKITNYSRQIKRIISAAQQCGRIDIPTLDAAQDLGSLLNKWNVDDTIILALEGCEKRDFLEIIRQEAHKNKITFMVGPEGGFSEKEKHLLENLSFIKSVSLGKNILRTETAAITMLAVSQLS